MAKQTETRLKRNRILKNVCAVTYIKKCPLDKRCIQEVIEDISNYTADKKVDLKGKHIGRVFVGRRQI